MVVADCKPALLSLPHLSPFSFHLSPTFLYLSLAPSINIHNSMDKDYFPSASGLPGNGGLLLPPPPPYRPGSPALSELSTPYSSPAPSPVPSPGASPLHSPFYTPNHSPCPSPTPPLRASQPGMQDPFVCLWHPCSYLYVFGLTDNLCHT